MTLWMQEHLKLVYGVWGQCYIATWSRDCIYKVRINNCFLLLIYNSHIILEFTRETEPIGLVDEFIHYEELAHVDMEAEKFYHLSLAGWRLRRADGINSSLSPEV